MEDPLPQGPERDDGTEMTSLTVLQDLGEITPRLADRGAAWQSGLKPRLRDLLLG